MPAYCQTEAPYFDAVPLNERHCIVQDGEQLGQMVRAAETSRIFAFDYETDGVEWFRGKRPAGMALTVRDGSRLRSWYAPCRHVGIFDQLDPEPCERAWRDILMTPAEKIGHNTKFELHFSRRIGIQPQGVLHDTMIASHLVDETIALSLKRRAEYHLNDPHVVQYEEAIDREKKRLAKLHGLGIKEYLRRFGYAAMDPWLVGRYACHDTDMTFRLHEHLHGLGTIHGELYDDEMALLQALQDMEFVGLPIDTQYLEYAHGFANTAMERATREFFDQLGIPKDDRFSLGSNEQLAALLVRMGLGLPRDRKTKNYKVDAKTLADYREANPWLKGLFDYRDAQKIRGTYSLNLMSQIVDGVLFGAFNQMGTGSGRLSSKEPNLQNIPGTPKEADRIAMVTECARLGLPIYNERFHPMDIRQAFLIQRSDRDRDRLGLYGHLYRLMLDYSQVELRVLAHYSQDPRMVATYLNDGDIHEEVENQVFGTGRTTDAGDVNRRFSKVINFGLCLTGDSLVLTNEGLVRLDRVRDRHSVWDGVEWVRHEGLICRGYQEVITYAGVTATPEHVVYLEDGTQTSLASAARRGMRLACGEMGGEPVGYQAHLDRQGLLPWEAQGVGGGLLRLPPPGESTQPPRMEKVYDLINAGPRHRFTANGRIVSNSYGMTGAGYARQIGRTREEGEQVFAEYGRKFPGVLRFKQNLFAHASQNHGTITSMFGRRYHVPEINSHDRWERLSAERKIIALLIQGSAAELTKKTIARTWNALRREGFTARLSQTVHDEWQIDTPESEVGQVAALAVEIAEQYPMFRVPIRVGLKTSDKSWSDVDVKKVIE